MKKIEALLLELENKIPHHQKINPAVSASNIAWHIDHSAIVIYKIIAAVKASNPEEYTSKFNFIKTLVYTINKIPRGKGKAPKTVLPQGEITTQSLKDNVALAKAKLSELNNLHAKNYFAHPFFGNLNLKETIKFLAIHTKHHLKIIEDIAK